MPDAPIIECVLNLSDGRNRKFLDELYGYLNEVEGCRLAHQDEGYDVNRTVITLIGVTKSIFRAVEIVIIQSLKYLNIQDHQGVHPRVGILDVIPFVPMKGISQEELEDLVKSWSAKMAREYQMPIILYGNMATQVGAITLAQIRKGRLPKLKTRIEQEEISLDYGSEFINSNLGISCVTTRDIMVAFNINLKTEDLNLVKTIAKDLKVLRKYDRRLKDVRFLAWRMESLGQLQISTNIYDTSAISMMQLFQLVKEVSGKYKVRLNGSELIGLTTVHAMAHHSIETDKAINELGLNSIHPFDKEHRILDQFIK